MKNHRFVLDENKARNLTDFGSGECALIWTTFEPELCHILTYSTTPYLGCGVMCYDVLLVNKA